MDPDVISQLSFDYTYDFIIDPSEVDNRLTHQNTQSTWT